MKYLPVYAALVSVALLNAPSTGAAPSPACPPAPGLQSCFTPGQNCERLIVGVIDGARSEVLLQTYKFTSKPIVFALRRAAARGVHVRLILDKSLEKQNSGTFRWVARSDMEIRIDHAVRTAHNKVVIADRAVLVTGSFNFTRSAELNNAENIIIIRNAPDVVRSYYQNWLSRYDASRPLA